MKPYRPERLVIEQGSEDFPLAQRILDNLSDLPVERVKDLDPFLDALSREVDPVSEGKKCLLLSRYPGEFVKKCPGTQGFVCCNYTVLNAVTGCPLDCSYCILQSYLYNNPVLRVFTNLNDLFARLSALFAGSRKTVFRVGTGELADSLALDPITGLSRDLVPFFGRQENAILELKTKTDHVENLLDLPHQGHTVVAWSVNPDWIIASHEKGCATLTERLDAATCCWEAGYRTAFHFDPIFFDPDWEKDYSEVVDRIFAAIPPESIAWISLGGLRFSPDVKAVIRTRFPQSRLLAGELVPCPDNKFRYVRPVRLHGYRTMLGWIRAHGPEVPVYLCMESREVWEAVFKNIPAGIENLAGIF